MQLDQENVKQRSDIREHKN